ncbi:MAG: hypothetical protein E7021_00440 [Alphaproteobacteria bacterium]|nr:hypothetical protein [Alphaproteobacteria bacterium]
MDFLKNTDNSDMILWHGTCADFDIFYPLSYFAVDRHVSDSAEFYQKQRYAHRTFISDDEIMPHKLQELQESLSRVLGNKTSLQSQEKHPNFKIIPAHLKMKNPLQLSSWEFHLDKALIGLVWGLTRREQENSLDTMQEANVTGDFIFKDSQMCPHEQVKKELAMGHLYPISQNEEENRYHLTAQRLILFLENLGYDGVQYDYMKNSVDAYRSGKIKDLDNRAFVVFRPEQVVRLDKKVKLPNTQLSPKEKIELNKIFYRYQQTHRPYKINQQELMQRACWGSVIKNKLHIR